MSTDPSPVARRVGAAIAAASILGSLNSCSSDSKNSDTSTADDSKTATSASGGTAEFKNLRDDASITTHEYVGAISGTDIYAAFAISSPKDGGASGGQAYFCDGTSIANWFTLADKGGKLQFVANSGETFDAVRGSDGAITATVTLSGKSYPVTAAQVDSNGEAGLYLADHAIDPDLAADERGGWIVLPDGTQRGAIRGGSTVLPGMKLEIATGKVAIPGRDILLRAISEIIGLDKK
jgi:hypothetical protein